MSTATIHSSGHTSTTVADIAADYHRDGFVILPGLLGNDECAGLKAEARRLLDAPALPGTWRSPSVLVNAAGNSDLYRALAEDRRLLPLLWELLPGGPMFLSDKLVFKSRDQRHASPWHADHAYWPGTRPKLSVWIALDPATADNGALVVVPGSHRSAWEHRHGHGVGTATEGAKREFVHTVEATWPKECEQVCAVPRGSAIVFSDRLLHGSTANTAGSDRYSLISTFHAAGPDEAFDRDHCPARRVLPRPVLGD